MRLNRLSQLTVEALLSKGYLPKELPPAFSSESFGRAVLDIEKRWNKLAESIQKKYRESTCVRYSIPRVNYSRRIISIPNPLHQWRLAKVIADNWEQIEQFCRSSKLSASRPIVDSSDTRALSTLKKFSEYKKAYVQDSFDKLYEIKTDIARFYPSIYTHSIAWAIHGKADAKKNKHNKSYLGNALDIAIRSCQSNQTIGIPIGPDTSFVVAEIIGSAIDMILMKKYKVNGYRYVDDYHLFCRSHEEAEHLLKYLQSCFALFELDMNDSKSDIVKFPQPFESRWTIELSSFRFSTAAKRQKNQLGQFFSLLYQSYAEHPEESVIKYGLKTLSQVDIHESNWTYFESLLLKTVIANPQCLPELFAILARYCQSVQKIKLRRALREMLSKHNDKKHSFELSWVLWFAKSFRIRLPAKYLQPILSSGDVIPTIIAMDLYRCKLVTGKLNIRQLRDLLTNESLMDDHWLLTYELIRKGWIKKKDNPVKKNPFFRILFDKKIEFYDASRKLPARLEITEDY